LPRGALADLEQFVDFLRNAQLEDGSATLPLVIDALRLLERHPEVGRPANDGLRELLISRGRSGYVALNFFDEVCDDVWVLGVRHRRDAGYGTR